MRHSCDMNYADRSVCIACRAPVAAGATECPRCHVDLRSAEVHTAWQALESADAWLARAPRGGTASPAPLEGGVPPSAAPRSRLTAEAVILALGAFCVIAAGTVFAVLAWGDLSIAARAAVLLAATALAGGAAALVTVRHLRASAEALWAVFLGLFTLDWFAAREEGLFDLDRVDMQVWAVVWSVLVLAAATAIVMFGRRHLADRELVSASITAGLTGLIAGIGVAAIVADRTAAPFAWEAGAGLAAAWVFAAGQLVGRLRVGRWVGLGSAGVFFMLFAGGSAALAIDNPALDDLMSGDGLPLLVAAGAAALAGVRVPQLRVPFGVVAGIELLLLVLLPVEDAWRGVGGYVVAAVAVVLAATVKRSDSWFLSVRIGSLLVGLGLAAATMPWYGSAVVTLFGAMFDDEALGGIDMDRWGIPLLVGAALAGTILLASRWSGRWQLGPTAVPAAGIVGVFHVVVAAAVATDYRVIEVYTAPLAAAAIVGGLYAMRRRPELGTWPALGGGMVFALVPSLPQAMADTLSVRALLLGLLAAGVVAVGAQRRWQAPFISGVVALALVAFSQVWPTVSAIPPWALLATGGVLLLVVGTTWERRVQQGRTAVQYVAAMR